MAPGLTLLPERLSVPAPPIVSALLDRLAGMFSVAPVLVSSLPSVPRATLRLAAVPDPSVSVPLEAAIMPEAGFTLVPAFVALKEPPLTKMTAFGVSAMADV